MLGSDARLDDLPACALDLETTGLSVTEDRTVSVGAVVIDGNTIARDQIVDRLVNPRVPIPKRASMIHGITDTIVDRAPTIDTVMPSLHEFMSDRVVVGHHIGFDLAVLNAEAARIGLDHWSIPAHLDTGQLAAGMFRGLHDVSLEALAERLDVTIVGRHSALGDAMAAAEIWIAMIPYLQMKGIYTLGAAQVLAAKAKRLIREQRRAGWVVDGNF